MSEFLIHHRGIGQAQLPNGAHRILAGLTSLSQPYAIQIGSSRLSRRWRRPSSAVRRAIIRTWSAEHYPSHDIRNPGRGTAFQQPTRSNSTACYCVVHILEIETPGEDWPDLVHKRSMSKAHGKPVGPVRLLGVVIYAIWQKVKFLFPTCRRSCWPSGPRFQSHASQPT